MCRRSLLLRVMSRPIYHSHWKDFAMPRRGVNRITLKFSKSWAADQGPDDRAVRVTLALGPDQPAREDRVQ
jgi:hypothetical protein